MTKHLTAPLSLVAAAALTACAHSPAPAPIAPRSDALATAPATSAATSTDFPAATSILAGFDLADGPVQWRIGDRVLLGIRFANHEVVTERLVLVELTSELAHSEGMTFEAGTQGRPYVLKSEVARTRITLYDRDGVILESATGRFPVKLLGFGLYDGACWSVGWTEPPTEKGTISDASAALNDADYDRMMRGWLTLFSFSGSLSKKGLFREMMHAVIARPSLLAMLLNPSVSMQSQPPGPMTGEPWTLGTAGGGVPIETISVPITLSISGKEALIGSILAARPAAPLSLCGGVLMATARNPDDPGVHVQIRLLGAARGEGGREFGLH